MSESGKGRKFSEEHKAKIGLANRKRVYKERFKVFLNEWKELKNQGLNYVQIAEKYNTNGTTVSRYFKKYIPE